MSLRSKARGVRARRAVGSLRDPSRSAIGSAVKACPLYVAEGLERRLLLSGAIQWSSTSSLPSTGYQYDAVEHDDNLYIVGGYNGSSLNTVRFAHVNSDGSLGSWATTTPLPAADQGPGVAVVGQCIYVWHSDHNLYSATFNADGTLGSWYTQTAPPTNAFATRLALEAYGGHLYQFGGWGGYGTYYSDVHVATLGTGGAVLSWASTTSMPEGRQHESVDFWNGRAYIVGGASGGPLSTAYSAPVNSDGTLGAWRQEASLPAPLWQHNSVVAGGQIYLFGGMTAYSGGAGNWVYRGAIDPSSGSISSWSLVGNTPGSTLVAPGAVYVESVGRAYLIGGLLDGCYTSQTWASPLEGVVSNFVAVPPHALYPGHAYTVTVDYTDARGSADIQNVYLRLAQGDDEGSNRQTMMWSLDTNWRGYFGDESHHVSSMTSTRTEITGGWRVTWTFTLDSSWVTSSNVDYYAWAAAYGDSVGGGHAKNDRNAIYDSGLGLWDAWLGATLVDNDGDEYYSQIGVHWDADTALASRQVNVMVYRQPDGAGAITYLGETGLYTIYGSQSDDRSMQVTAPARGNYDFGVELYDADGNFVVSRWYDPDSGLTGVKMESAAEDRPPDLIATNATCTINNSAEPGSTWRWGVDVTDSASAGDLTGRTWQLEFVLSSDTAIGNADDVVIGGGPWNMTDAFTPGQTINYSGDYAIPASVSMGSYYYGVRLLNVAGEVDTSNNTTYRTNSIWIGSVAADGFEANDQPVWSVLHPLSGWATDLGTVRGTNTTRSLTLDSASDVDWYAFTMPHTANASDYVQLSLHQTEGAAALYVYPSDHATLVGQHTEASDVATVSLAGHGAGLYYVRVVGIGGDVQPAYSLAIHAIGLTAPSLASRPGAPATLYLNFTGDMPRSFTTNWLELQGFGAWPYPVPSTPAYDGDGDPSSYSATELEEIEGIWARVAEKYSPFDVNVTTSDPGALAHGQVEMVVIGGSWRDWLHDDCGGISAIGGFYDSTFSNVCYVFSADIALHREHFVGETASHEAGHAFGLSHQSTTGENLSDNDKKYYHGDSLRVPIMGASSVSIMKRGLWWLTNQEDGQQSSDPIQDDLVVLNSDSNGFHYRPDDHGNTLGSADPLTRSGNAWSYAGANGFSGVIEQNNDQDWFSFTTGAGTVAFTVDPAPYGGMLDATLELRDSGGNLITRSDSLSLGETVTARLAAGSYRVVVGSHGGYGDIGQYTLTGTLTPNQLPTVGNISKPSINYHTTLAFTASDFASAFSDPDAGDSLQKVLITSLPGRGTLRLNGQTVAVAQEIPVDQLDVLTYTPASGYSGPVSFGWTGADPFAYAATPATVSVTILDQPPVASDATCQGFEDQPWTVTMPATDVDGPSLSYVITSGPSHGTLDSGTGAGRVYHPTPDWNGTDSFTFKAFDGQLYSDQATVTIQVAAVNDRPTFTATGFPSVGRGTGAHSITYWATFSPGPANESGQTCLGYTVTNVSNPALFAVPPAVSSDGTLTYTLAPDILGFSTFTVAARDSGGTSNGGIDTSTTRTYPIVVVSSFAMSGVLSLYGTTSADASSLSVSGANVTVAMPGGSATFPTGAFQSVRVFGWSGSDSLAINSGSFTFATDLGVDTPDLAMTVTGAVAVFTATQHLTGLTINAGGVTVPSSGGANTLVLSSLSISRNAQGVYTSSLNLLDNNALIRAGTVGAWDSAAAAYDGITGMVASAYANGGGIRGIMATGGGGNHGLGVLTGGQAAANGNAGILAAGGFHGQTAGSDDVMVQYVWNGDMNFDSALDYLDYGVIDNAYLWNQTHPADAKLGYANGDLNFDGVVNYLDYGMMDNAYLAQTAPHGTASASAAPSAAESLVTTPGAGVFATSALARKPADDPAAVLTSAPAVLA